MNSKGHVVEGARWGPDAVAATVTAVVEAGAVGVNLEDRSGHPGAPLYTPTEQAERLAAARTAASRRGIRLWINARTDIFLADAGAAERRLDEALQRAERYAAAGADSLFVPGLVDLTALAELAAGPLPVAVMVWPGAPPVADLAAVGVARISLGPAIAQAAYAVAARGNRAADDGHIRVDHRRDPVRHDEQHDPRHRRHADRSRLTRSETTM